MIASAPPGSYETNIGEHTVEDDFADGYTKVAGQCS